MRKTQFDYPRSVAAAARLTEAAQIAYLIPVAAGALCFAIALSASMCLGIGIYAVKHGAHWSFHHHEKAGSP